MEYRPLGRSGMSVSQLCLGAMMFGAAGNPDHDDSVKIIHRALDAGINFIDTADVYSTGESEQIVGQALADGRRDSVVLATKAGLPFGRDPNQRGTSRRWITQAVEGSLRRLGTDWIDLYQIHRLDPATDVNETLGALSDLVHAGKIRAFGASNVPASEIVEAQWIAERRGRERFRTEQPPYSLLTRAIEHDVLPACLRYGMGVLVYSPLAGGWLSGRYRKGARISGPTSAARGATLPRGLRQHQPGQRGQARRRRRPRRARRPGRADPGPAGHRVRHPAPCGHRRDRRPAHDGSPGVLPGRRRRRAERRRPRPDRRDRAARAHRQHRRQHVADHVAGPRIPPPLARNRKVVPPSLSRRIRSCLARPGD